MKAGIRADSFHSTAVNTFTRPEVIGKLKPLLTFLFILISTAKIWFVLIFHSVRSISEMVIMGMAYQIMY